jgi:hypothetical protein
MDWACCVTDGRIVIVSETEPLPFTTVALIEEGFVAIVVPPTWKVPCEEVIVVLVAGVVVNEYVSPWLVVIVLGML